MPPKTKNDDTEVELKADLERLNGEVKNLEAKTKQYEDFLTQLLPDIRLVRVQLQDVSPNVSERFTRYYRKVEELLGANG